MSDLTDFLLARIAEDEAEARDAIKERDSIPFTRPVSPDYDLKSWPDVGVPAVLVGPERVLAECEAKRRIVEDRIHLDTVRPGAIRAHSEWVCRVLATVHADHPDYREEWKP